MAQFTPVVWTLDYGGCRYVIFWAFSKLTSKYPNSPAGWPISASQFDPNDTCRTQATLRRQKNLTARWVSNFYVNTMPGRSFLGGELLKALVFWDTFRRGAVVRHWSDREEAAGRPRYFAKFHNFTISHFTHFAFHTFLHNATRRFRLLILLICNMW